MSYEELSDFEINKLVAIALNEYEAIPDGRPTEMIGDVEHYYDETRMLHACYDDYCNNPSDAWPIIVENRISIDYLCVTKTWVAAESEDRGETYHINDNPLRAAMIVFLKMNPLSTNKE